jgi:hypothetical protein
MKTKKIVHVTSSQCCKLYIHLLEYFAALLTKKLPFILILFVVMRSREGLNFDYGCRFLNNLS